MLAKQCASIAEFDISSEEITYLITWVPNPKLLSNDQCTNYVRHYSKYFMKFYQCMTCFVISPELTQNGNIHYHGWFQLRDRVRWFKQVLPSMKYSGYVKIDPVRKDLRAALKYYKKDILFADEFFADICVPVPITHHDIIPKESLITKKQKLKKHYEHIQDLINRDWSTKQYLETKDLAVDIAALLNIK